MSSNNRGKIHLQFADAASRRAGLKGRELANKNESQVAHNQTMTNDSRKIN
jgi:hypothetical protein